MHVGIFASPELQDHVRTVMQMLARNRIACSGLTIAPRWADADLTSWFSRFAAMTHLVLVPAEGTFPEWAVFIAGVAAGKGVPIAVVSDTGLDPVYQRIVAVNLDSIENYMLSERSTWDEINRVESARHRLHGRESDPDAFADALLAGDFARVEDFLTVGMSPDARSTLGVPALVGAVRGGSVEITQRLLGAGSNVDSACGTGGESALCEAASRGHGTIVGVLLAHGATPNQRTQSGQTALMLAASQGHLEIVEHLIAAGADPRVSDSLEMCAVDYAKLFGRNDILEQLETIVDRA